MKAVILILKHATFLRLSNLSAKSALTLAELDYQEANVDLTVQQHLAVPSQEHSVDIFVAFIMATDIGLSILSFSHIVVSHQTLVHGNSHSRGHWFKRLFRHCSVFFPCNLLGLFKGRIHRSMSIRGYSTLNVC